jgi:hypothetical protein
MTEGGVRRRTAELRARMTVGWSRAAGLEQWSRSCGAERASDPVQQTLDGLESDLSYLEELPGDRIARSQAALGQASERLERLAASLKRPA